VRINDISVSRTHAFIEFSEDKIFIKDLKSKFGTLVLINQNVEIEDKAVCLQIGRTHAEFSTISHEEYLKLKKE